MSIGILYDSIEWSNQHIADLVARAGIEADLINLDREPVDFDRIGKHALLVNRLFPSAHFRDHERAFALAPNVLRVAHGMGLAMVNSYDAFAYDWSKMCTGLALERHGIAAPSLSAYFAQLQMSDRERIVYPAVMKPECGGRSLHTYILEGPSDLERALKDAPAVPFLIQAYVEPAKGYTTRIEIVGGKVVSVMKRFVGDNAISSYHAGSVFEAYPDCPEVVTCTALRTLQLLHMDMGSLDIIETDNNAFFIIDVNGTTNFSEDNIAMFGYDPIRPIADYIISRHGDTTENRR